MTITSYVIKIKNYKEFNAEKKNVVNILFKIQNSQIN